MESVTADRTVEWASGLNKEGGCFPPALAIDGTVYVSCIGKITAVAPTGIHNWTFSIPDHRIGSPAIAEDGTLYFGCDDRHVYALASDGNLKWKFETKGKVLSTPAIALDGTIFFGAYDGKLYAVSAEGKLRWEYATGARVFSPTIGPDGTIYAQSAEGKLYAIQDIEQNGGISGQWPKFGGGLANTERGRTLN